VILEGEITDEELSALEKMHVFPAEEHPPPGAMDWYYLLFSDAGRPLPPAAGWGIAPWTSRGPCTASTFAKGSTSSFTRGHHARIAMRALGRADSP
jgi:hypothetical protein